MKITNGPTGHGIAYAEKVIIFVDARIPKTPCVLLEYGVEKEGYWNSDRFMGDIKDAVAIAEFKYPPWRIEYTCAHF